MDQAVADTRARGKLVAESGAALSPVIDNNGLAGSCSEAGEPAFQGKRTWQLSGIEPHEAEPAVVSFDKMQGRGVSRFDSHANDLADEDVSLEGGDPADVGPAYLPDAG